MAYADGLRSTEYYLDKKDSSLQVFRAWDLVFDIVNIAKGVDIANTRFIGLRILDYTQAQFVGSSIGGDFEMPFNCRISTINANSDTFNIGGDLRFNVLKNGVSLATVSIQNGRKTTRVYSTVTLNNVVVNKGDIITFDIISIAEIPANGLTITLETILTSL